MIDKAVDSPTKYQAQALDSLICIDGKFAESEIKSSELTQYVGKTRIACNIINELKTKKPDLSVLIVVPQINLKSQWDEKIQELPNSSNIEICVINTCVTKNWSVNLLIIDEIHTVASDRFITVFDRVGFNLALGLTGTIKRLDGLESRILSNLPIVDTITFTEAYSKGWVSQYEEYKVLIETDLTEYYKINREFDDCFAFFGQDFKLANGCARSWKTRAEFARFSGLNPKMITAKAFGFDRSMKKRKEWVYNNKKKLELADYIISKLPDKKIITFSMAQSIAESIKTGTVYHSKMKKKERDTVLKEFNEAKSGVLNTVSAVNAGVDISGLNTAIFVGSNSSQIAYQQRFGRICRCESADKLALVFHLIIKGTVEESWFARAHKDSEPSLVMREKDLINYLEGREFEVFQDEDNGLNYYS